MVQRGIAVAADVSRYRWSRRLRREFPHLESELPALWASSYFPARAIGAILEVIKRYVENRPHAYPAPFPPDGRGQGFPGYSEVIVSVCSDKGSPGVTTLAAALSVVWPGERVLLDADSAGGDLPFRLWGNGSGAQRERLSSSPSVASLATAARLGLTAAGPLPFAQDTSLGVPVVPGALSAERFRPLRAMWPRVAAELAAWPGTVIADLGRLQPGNDVLPVAQQSTAVLLVTRVDLESLAHLRDRVVELAGSVGDPGRDRSPVGVVVTGPVKARKFVVEQARLVLASIGSPVPVVGFFAQDPAGAQGLWAGVMTRRFAGSDLVRATRVIAESVLGVWPSLIPAPASGNRGPQVGTDGAGIEDAAASMEGIVS